MGMIRLRGKKYWIKYYRNGKPYEESVDKTLGIKGSTRADAKKLLAKREGAIVDGRFFGLAAEKTQFGGFREVEVDSESYDYKTRDEKKYVVYGMVKELIDDYRLNKRRSIKKAFQCSWHLSQKLSGYRMSQIGTDIIKEYKVLRSKDRAANATINRELAALRRIFHLAQSSTPPRVSTVPKIELLEEDNVRTGFFEHHEYLAVRNQAPEYLRLVIDFGYVFGGRSHKDILSLEWSMVDMISGKVNVGKSKNGKPRIWYLTPDLYQALLDRKMRRDRDYPDQKKVFVHPDGTPILDFRDAWEGACRRAGIEGMLFHDLRRTAVRNMVRAGIPRKVAMLISGHLTESVFERYNIVDESDISSARDKMVGYYETMAEKINDYSKKVTATVTKEEMQVKERK